MTGSTVSIRPVEPTDVGDIVRIDEHLGGQTRKDYWQARVDVAALRPPWMSLVAVADGRVVGFLFGWVGESEFGIARRIGWIDLIGVDPPYRGHGVGRALVDRFVASGRELRAVSTVATLIDIGQPDVREFFVGLGLRPGPMIQLEMPV